MNTAPPQWWGNVGVSQKIEGRRWFTDPDIVADPSQTVFTKTLPLGSLIPHLQGFRCSPIEDPDGFGFVLNSIITCFGC